MQIQIINEVAKKLFIDGEQLIQLCTDVVWAEGPVWLPEQDALLFSDVKDCKIYRYSATDGLSIYRNPSHFANGNTLDRQGNLISCEHGRRCISRTDKNQNLSVVVEYFEGKRLNSPNDVIVKSDGTIWFSDPPYGIINNEEGYAAHSQIIGCYVYCYNENTKELTIATTDVQRPNGLAFSPDEKTLYVADMSIVEFPQQGRHELRAFDVVDNQLINGRKLLEIEPGIPDGFRIDKYGNIFCSCEDGIWVISPSGEKLAKIFVPERVSNCTFGGYGQDILYITATTSVYAIKLNTSGIQYNHLLKGN